jgi:hypothetical protein
LRCFSHNAALMTLEQAEARLTLYYNAEAAILEGAQAYTIHGRSFTRADLATIQKVIEQLEAKVQTLTRGGIRMRTGVPL